jgi:hypothetical protein
MSDMELDEKCPVIDIGYGIPQGSILTHFLFLLYLNDLPHYVEHSMSDLYADDTTIHFSSNSISHQVYILLTLIIK